MSDEEPKYRAPECDLMKLAYSDPDAALGLMAEIIKKEPDQAFNLYVRCCGFMALKSKGILPLKQAGFSRVDVAEPHELHQFLADEHLDSLELALHEIPDMQKLDEDGEALRALDADLDLVACIVERSRPGKVQSLLGWTKLWYFGLARLTTMPYLKKSVQLAEVRQFIRVPFNFPRVVMSALAYYHDTDDKGRAYMSFYLFPDFISDWPPEDKVGDHGMGTVTIYSDGTYQIEQTSEHQGPGAQTIRRVLPPISADWKCPTTPPAVPAIPSEESPQSARARESKNEIAESLRIANSYIEEIEGSIGRTEDLLGNQALARQLLENLDLADKHIARAGELVRSGQGSTFDEELRHTKARSLYYRGLIHGFGLVRASAGIRYLEQSIRVKPDDSAAHFNLGLFYANTARRDEALRHLRRAVELAPDDLECRKMLDRIEKASGLQLRLRAFRGSLSCLGVLGLFALVSLVLFLVALSLGEFGMMARMLFSVGFWGGIGYLYWRVKSR